MKEVGMRRWTFRRGVNIYAEGSCLVEAGDTRVLCTASVVETVPEFLAGTGRGWLTAEYSMLPRATRERTTRAVFRGRPDGRGAEIQRFIGRSLRAALEPGYLGERTIYIDCDVLQADGGTRTAAVNGGMVALAEALVALEDRGVIRGIPLVRMISALSVGKVNGEIVLDLDYEKDSSAQVDLNLVMGDDGSIIEIQGTSEGEPMTREELGKMLDAASEGVESILRLQKEALGEDILGRLGGS